MLYIDSSVLPAHTVTQSIEPTRAPAASAFFARVQAGTLAGATSFYALHEVYLFALDNAPDFSTGVAYGKAALEKFPPCRWCDCPSCPESSGGCMPESCEP